MTDGGEPERIEGPFGSVAFDGHTVEVVGGALKKLSRLPLEGIMEVKRFADEEGRECVLFFGRGASASTRFPAEQAGELDRMVGRIQSARG